MKKDPLIFIDHILECAARVTGSNLNILHYGMIDIEKKSVMVLWRDYGAKYFFYWVFLKKNVGASLMLI